MDYEKAFFAQLCSFLDKLSVLFPKEDIFDEGRNSINMARRVTADRVLVLRFYDEVMPYKPQIKSRDETFFLQMEYGEDSIMASLQLKELYRVMSEQDRESVWKYLALLLVLAEKVKHTKPSSVSP